MTGPPLTVTAPFGRTGVAVSPLCLGTSSWGPPRPRETADDRDARVASMVDPFLAGELATNLLDTSNMYGDSLSEEHIGRGIARAGGVHGGLVIQTKLDRRLGDDDFSAEQMWRSLEESLERLGLDRIQVMYLHDPEVIGFDAAMRHGGPVDALLAMKARGLVGAIGISGGPVRMLQRFVETDLFDALVTHNRFTLVDRSANALLDAATERRMGITNAAPFGAGVLTGDARFAGTYGYKPITPEVARSVAAMTGLCREAGVPLSAAALQFSMRNPRVHSTIVGVSTRKRFDQAAADASIALPEGLWAALDDVAPTAFALDDA